MMDSVHFVTFVPNGLALAAVQSVCSARDAVAARGEITLLPCLRSFDIVTMNVAK
jgi:hypothetical protein